MKDLKALIRSLNPNEIRTFNHHAARSGREEPLYKALFELIQREDEAAIEKKFPNKKSRAVLANALFENILESLEYAAQTPQEQIRKHLNNAEHLYNRGLQREAIKRLEAAKTIARQTNLFGYCLEAIKWLKRLEPHKLAEYTAEYIEICETIASCNTYENYHIQFMSFIRRQEVCKTEKEKKQLADLLQDLPTKSPDELCLLAHLDYIRCHIIYARLLLLFDHNVAWCKQALAIFDQNPLFKQAHPNLYAASLLNLRIAFFDRINLTTNPILPEEVVSLNKLLAELSLPKPIAAQVFTYTMSISLTQIMYLKNHSSAEKYKKAALLQKQYEHLKDQIKHEGHQIYHANFVNFYFSEKNYPQAEHCINKLQDFKPLRPDIASFARIWTLIIQYEIGNKQWALNQTMSARQYLRRNELLFESEKIILLFFESLLNAHTPQEQYNLFKKLQQDLAACWQSDPKNRVYGQPNLEVWIEEHVKYWQHLNAS